jgi:hypothetical protein
MADPSLPTLGLDHNKKLDFSNSGQNTPAATSCLPAEPEAPILKMAERADWTLFRTLEGLAQKAGVPAHRLRRLVLKELADNALDAGGQIHYGQTDHGAYFIEDDGPGLDGTPQEIATLFSIARPLRSSKLIRLPQRGQLGNGLRVVAGAVLASEGTLVVTTRNKRIGLRPELDGSTTVVGVADANKPVGTRIEVSFGPALPSDSDPFKWVSRADALASVGQEYSGRSSPYWYDAAQFYELILAYGDEPVRSVVAQLDGCTGGKAGEIVAARRTRSQTLSGHQSRASGHAAAESARRGTSGQSGSARVYRPRRLRWLPLCQGAGHCDAWRFAAANSRSAGRGRGMVTQDQRSRRRRCRDLHQPHAECGGDIGVS